LLLPVDFAWEAEMEGGEVRFCVGAFELQYLVLIAERRNCVKQAFNVTNRRCDSRTDFTLNLQGIMGEFCASKYLGVPLDTTVSIKGDDGIDLLYRGHSIQVKTRLVNRDDNYLYFNSCEHFKADIAVLAIVTSVTEVSLLGWIKREEFCQKSQPGDFGHGPRQYVAQAQLHAMPKLKAIEPKEAGQGEEGEAR
jgi:hypothetical protein